MILRNSNQTGRIPNKSRGGSERAQINDIHGMYPHGTQYQHKRILVNGCVVPFLVSVREPRPQEQSHPLQTESTQSLSLITHIQCLQVNSQRM